jgi:3-hydroxyacyl-CoA dehydrogenase
MIFRVELVGLVYSMADTPRRVGVVGLGLMGFDIAFLYAMKGFHTVVYDAARAAMDSLLDRREQTIERLQKRNRINDAEIENVRKLLLPSADLGGLARMDLVTEAVSENVRTKKAVYRALRDAGFSGILTTNTSSVTRATLLAGDDYDRRKFVLTHFFNPVLYTQMVEVVKGDMQVSYGDDLISFLKEIGRQPVETRDISGFVSNGILMVYAVMALRLLQCGGRIDAVDQAAKELKLLPPLISFDSWKPSIVEDVTRVMFDLRGDPFLRSSKLLSYLAQNNPKFYVDQKPNPAIYKLSDAPDRSLDNESVKRALQISMTIAAARVAELGESPATVDFIATEGIKMPQPPLKEIDRIGPATVLEELATTNRELRDQPLTPPKLLSTMKEERQTFYENDQPNPWLSAYIERSAAHASH